MKKDRQVTKQSIEIAFARYDQGKIPVTGEGSQTPKRYGISHPVNGEICPPKMIWNIACHEAGAEFRHYPELHRGFEKFGYKLYELSPKEKHDLKSKIEEKQFSQLSDSKLKQLLKDSPKKVKKVRVQTIAFNRDPVVREITLRQAKGKCRICKKTPFYRPGGDPYLEVHHIIPLAKGGDDSIPNTIALCPNCHREQHHGKSPKSLPIQT